MTTSSSPVPTTPTTVEALLDERDTLREYLLERLEPPSLDLLRLLSQAAKAVGEVDVRSLEMSNEETGEDNRSAIRALENDTETIANSVSDALSTAVEQTLVRPFREALSTARALNLGLDEWSPQDWITSMLDPAVPGWAHRDLLTAVLDQAAVQDVPGWYELIQESRWLHRWDAWASALPAAPHRPEVLNHVLDRLLADDRVQRPSPARGKPPVTTPMDEVKRQGLTAIAWNGLLSLGGTPGSASLRRAIWARVPPVPEQMDWNRLVSNLLSTASNAFYHGDDGLGVAPHRVDQLLAPFAELLATGALNDWLSRPEQWRPVDPSTVQTSPPVVPTPITWMGMAACVDAAGHAHLARRLRTMGESFDLHNTFVATTDGVTLVARERARL